MKLFIRNLEEMTEEEADTETPESNLGLTDSLSMRKLMCGWLYCVALSSQRLLILS